MLSKQMRITPIILIVLAIFACVSNAFLPLMSRQQQKVSRHADVRMMSEKPTESNDAISRRRKRRGKDEGAAITTPEVSFK
jgi:hypothetical protein